MKANTPTLYSLRELLAGMTPAPVPELGISDISSDSREVSAGGLFLACAGERAHGLDHLGGALAAGAAAVAWEPASDRRPPELPAGVAGVEVPGLRRHLGTLANRFFGEPSRELRVTGITGTNGKTTTAWLACGALGRLGQRAAYMGTLGWGLGPELSATALTTPDCITLHRRLRALASAGATHVVAEVSSHALAQRRTAGIAFSAGAFTNLSRDHLDYHGSLEAYGESKALLFTEGRPSRAVINTGDAFGRVLAERISGHLQLITVALEGREAGDAGVMLSGRFCTATPEGLGIVLAWEGREVRLESPLWGRFNAENLLLAAGVLLGEGYDLEACARALASCGAPPGRMQRLAGQPGQPLVLVDFAHTPAALEQALIAAREHNPDGALWCVFGCGGDRDRGKRAGMGRVAAARADHLVLTDDNPRDEDPAGIVEDILAGIPAGTDVEVVPDRVQAIALALRGAGQADVVLIAGKGHESEQLVRGIAYPLSDAQIASGLMGRPR